MTPLTLAEIAAAVGGTTHDAPDPQAEVTGEVVHDSRAVTPGSLFVAVVGERVDGHEFAAAAVKAGAVAVLAQRPVGVPAIVVEDTVRALGLLASAALRRLPGLTVVALTGSSGKTTTKDLTAQLLRRLGPTVAPPGNHNNEIGMPLTALRADADTRHLVLEMGARGIGHIRYLTSLTHPRIGMVLNVGTAHLGEFGSREAIAQAKGEMVESLPPAADGGVAVLNADDPLVRAMATRTRARVVLVGESPDAEIRAEDVTSRAGRASFTLRTPAGSAPVALRIHGVHQVANALAAAAAATELGMPVAEVAAALSEAELLSGGRMEVVDRPDGVTIINDAYNANPASMRAALRALVEISRAATPRRRTWAVLGAMYELGEASMREHDEIGRLAVRLDISKLVAVGETEASWLEMGARNEGSWNEESVRVADVGEAIELLTGQIEPGDVVLVKASRDVGLRELAKALIAAGEVRR